MQIGKWLIASTIVTLTACSSNAPKQEAAKTAEPTPTAPATAPSGSDTYKAKFETSKGTFLVDVHRDWAPLGAARFEELLKAKYFDGARFFRVVPNFVVQFGLAASPGMTKRWDKPIKDDPVAQTNRRGSLAFATMGKNTRTAQVFISLRSNQILDSQGFAPFAQVVDGMDVVDKLYSGYGEAPDQQSITKRGNAYLTSSFPKLDYIQRAAIVP